MDAKEFAEKTSKVIGTTKVTLTLLEYKDDRYLLQLLSDTYATVTGWVIVAKLIPKDENLPEFTFRWDHGMSEVDIDIFLDGKSRKDLWGESGYNGHKTIFSNNSIREYGADIWIPNRQIFKGVIKVGLTQGLNLKENIQITEHINVQIID